MIRKILLGVAGLVLIVFVVRQFVGSTPHRTPPPCIGPRNPCATKGQGPLSRLVSATRAKQQIRIQDKLPPILSLSISISKAEILCSKVTSRLSVVIQMRKKLCTGITRSRTVLSAMIIN